MTHICISKRTNIGSDVGAVVFVFLHILQVSPCTEHTLPDITGRKFYYDLSVLAFSLPVGTKQQCHWAAVAGQPWTARTRPRLLHQCCCARRPCCSRSSSLICWSTIVSSMPMISWSFCCNCCFRGSIWRCTSADTMYLKSSRLGTTVSLSTDCMCGLLQASIRNKANCPEVIWSHILANTLWDVDLERGITMSHPYWSRFSLTLNATKDCSLAVKWCW